MCSIADYLSCSGRLCGNEPKKLQRPNSAAGITLAENHLSSGFSSIIEISIFNVIIASSNELSQAPISNT